MQTGCLAWVPLQIPKGIAHPYFNELQFVIESQLW